MTHEIEYTPSLFGEGLVVTTVDECEISVLGVLANGWDRIDEEFIHLLISKLYTLEALKLRILNQQFKDSVEIGITHINFMNVPNFFENPDKVDKFSIIFKDLKNVMYINLVDTGIDIYGTIKLLDALPNKDLIRSINLSNNIYYFNELLYLLPSLRAMPSLKYLDISKKPPLYQKWVFSQYRTKMIKTFNTIKDSLPIDCIIEFKEWENFLVLNV